MNLPGKRILLGTAVATAALGIGGIAYAAGDEPAPEQGYVTIEEGATTPSPGTQGDGQNSRRSAEDCPEKNGGGEGQGQAQPEQTQPSQPEQTQPEQADPQSNA
ncbi:hypothetical protein EV643_117110 [Kribbella sp. VKM Ac-2527]|uniref:Uncharacterized protein n=1 Tax=Kribbella caucasensis TaxID=2512215 RepID=A0A4R6K5B0_9ACTN|nr:hypothetical protein [Kribbella sp. VKM Ac-2527]TDO44087.1 hypothetical protein EV643_117110 [Kribbella sp. VKM Ac-2527]